MALIDLSLPVPVQMPDGSVTAAREELRIQNYTGMIYHFRHDSMAGTYIDFPGHIKETTDGFDAANYPFEKLFRVKATVIHLDRAGGSGAVTAMELAAACPKPFRGQALVLNALGVRRFDAIESRSVWLGRDARRWIIERKIHLLVSDIYESQALEGVFLDLFGAGITTVCLPINLAALTTPYVRLTALPLRFETVTQLPCRVVAELIQA
ncbi:MAG: cyclase family protein [Verrucomicrobiota bacterium]